MKRTITATALIIALGGFLFGYDIAMISGTTAQLETLFNLSKFWLGFTVAIAIIGTIIGTMIIGKPVDKYGRRRMLICLSGLFVITTLGSSLSPNWYILLLFRFITGILLGGITVVTPMFIAEGSWRWMIGIEIIPALTFFLLLFKVPESPRWLLMKDRPEEALQVFKSYGFTDPVKEIKVILDASEKGKKASHAHLFTKGNRIPVITTILIAAFNNWPISMLLSGTGKYLLYSLQNTPVKLHDYRLTENITPSTVVLSDPGFDNGHGERMFINSIGAAWDYWPEQLDEAFFKSDIVVFGGTALVPEIHDGLTDLLKKSKSNGCMTIVNTVFDFRNEKRNPDQKWPLGSSDESYKYIDLLIADQEEALRLSGETTVKAAISFFADKQVSALIITNGSNPVSVYSNGQIFEKLVLTQMPVSKMIVDELKANKVGDTTGAGDNFVGGVIASIVSQMQNGVEPPNLQEASCWGIVSGGYACFYMGGTYFEQKSGEKLTKIKPYYESYQKQING